MTEQLKTVAAFVSYPWQHAVTWLRIARPLAAAGIEILQGSDPAAGIIRPELVSKADAVVIQREFPAYSGTAYAQIVQRARSEHKPLIYEIDDLLLELPPEHPDYQTHYYTYALLPILRAIIEANLVTTTTPILQTYYQALNPNSCVLQNYLDDSLWWTRPYQVKQPTEPVVIGYMGSTTHGPDLEMIAPAMEWLLKQYGNRIQLKFWGARPPEQILSPAWDVLEYTDGRPSNISWVPLEIPDYAKFAEFFSQQDCDIFIAPLANSFFNQCKSPIKFLEYSISGVPGVYSRLAPYQGIIQDGENGFLAGSLNEWQSALSYLIEHPEIRVRVGKAAQNGVLEGWRLSNHAQEWTEAYQKALEKTRSDASDPKAAGLTQDERTQIFLRVATMVQDWLEILNQRATQQNQTHQDLRAEEWAKAFEETHNELEHARRQLAEIQQSESWQLVTALDKVKRLLYPPGSQRERAVQKIASLLMRGRSSNLE